MDFIQYIINWCKGEIFEGKMFALFGVIVLIIAGLYWKFGHFPFPLTYEATSPIFSIQQGKFIAIQFKYSA